MVGYGYGCLILAWRWSISHAQILFAFLVLVCGIKCFFFLVESRFVSCVSWQYRRGMSLHFVLVKKRKDGIHRSRFDGGSVILVAPYPYHKIVPIACHYHCIHC